MVAFSAPHTVESTVRNDNDKTRQRKDWQPKRKQLEVEVGDTIKTRVGERGWRQRESLTDLEKSPQMVGMGRGCSGKWDLHAT